MRNYELMVILNPGIEEQAVAPQMEQLLQVVKANGGTVNKVDIWGKRRLSYEILKHDEGIYVVVELTATSDTVAELDRLLGLNESVLRTKVLRRDKR